MDIQNVARHRAGAPAAAGLGGGSADRGLVQSPARPRSSKADCAGLSAKARSWSKAWA